jgi:hypothetical protein
VEANNIDEQLAAALSETARLRSENERLRKLLRIRESCPQVVPALAMDAKAPIASSFSSDEKVRLFRGLFKGREDVYAMRWEGRNGKAGYSPACVEARFGFWPLFGRLNRILLWSGTDCKSAGFTPSAVRIHSCPLPLFEPFFKDSNPATL